MIGNGRGGHPPADTPDLNLEPSRRRGGSSPKLNGDAHDSTLTAGIPGSFPLYSSPRTPAKDSWQTVAPLECDNPILADRC